MDNILATVKDKIDDIVEKIKGDDGILAKFKANPVDTVKELLGNIDLPDDALDGIVDGIKAKLDGAEEGSVADKIGDLLDKAKGLFGGKDGE